MLSNDPLSSSNSESNLVLNQAIFYEATVSEYIANATWKKKPSKEKLKSLSVDLKTIQFKENDQQNQQFEWIHGFYTELSFSNYFLPKDLMTDIEYQTTLYPIKARSDWSTNVDENDIEIITYLLYMSIIKLPRIRNYWSSFIALPWITNDEFVELKIFLDFNDKTNECTDNAKMNKIHPLIEKLNKNNAMSTKRIKFSCR